MHGVESLLEDNPTAYLDFLLLRTLKELTVQKKTLKVFCSSLQKGCLLTYRTEGHIVVYSRQQSGYCLRSGPCPEQLLVLYCPLKKVHLDNPLSEHSISNFNKTSNVSSFNIIHLVLFSTVLNTGLMNIFHNSLQSLVYFITRPAVT